MFGLRYTSRYILRNSTCSNHVTLLNGLTPLLVANFNTAGWNPSKKPPSLRYTEPYISQNPSTVRNMSSNPELVCLGNPLLDYQATVDESYLKKYSLKSNDAILVEAGDDKMKIFEELLEFPDVKFVAGGAAQNTARGAAYVLGEGKVGYFGCVGKDKYSELLLQKNTDAGVISMYQVENAVGTGKCAALITGHDRSLVTDLGAANHFKAEHLDAHWDVVENAKMFYIGGFHLTVCPEGIVKLGKHAQETGKPFVLNLSAPFIPVVFKSALEQALPYATHIIANESEAAAYAEGFGLDVAKDDLETIGKHIVGDSPIRTVIFTQGTEPTIVISASGIKTYPVKPLEASKIVDTNGAGDAFAGGFMAGLVQGKDSSTAIYMGQWLASLSIQQVGPTYPEEKLEYQN
ncbi:HHL302Cp [Eremothecium sinecaudum]|uniref:adenosine kinase n=1 Tax=Eremothecium sinecaudum TaxID=45286 RepID=A0A109V0F1_9SACH|nr:HHL302Cp [Eremothecium sinecaudum]AMD22468.1 HHL302Cp [Eremothecium sinecaudum]